MSNFPTSLDDGTSLPNPTAGSTTNNPDHAGLHSSENASIIALETKMGIGASTPSGSNLLVSTGTGISAWSKVAPTGTIVGTSDSQTLTNKILTSPTINAPTITNATITADSITGFSVSNTGTIYGVPVTAGVILTANTVNGSSIVAASVGSTALATNAVQGNQLATSAITLGYAQITSNLTTTSATQVQATGLTSTVTIPSGSRRVRVSFFGNLQVGTAIKNPVVTIWDGTVGSGTQLNSAGFVIQNTGIDHFWVCSVVVTPAAGSKTYNIGWSSDGGGGVTTTLSAAATKPAYILVEAI